MSHTLFWAKYLLKKPRMRRSQKLYATLNHHVHHISSSLAIILAGAGVSETAQFSSAGALLILTRNLFSSHWYLNVQSSLIRKFGKSFHLQLEK